MIVLIADAVFWHLFLNPQPFMSGIALRIQILICFLMKFKKNYKGFFIIYQSTRFFAVILSASFYDVPTSNLTPRPSGSFS